ncbi:MAG: hypothetical protein AAGE43_20335 [Pseudomonadota bacterium]
MTIDDLSQHMAEAGSLDRAAVPLGLFLAWCGNLHLVSRSFQEAHEGPLLRLRYRELAPTEFLTTTTGGSLDTDHLSEEGRSFVASYYGAYLDDLREVFGGDLYGVKGDWSAYERMAGVVTRRYMDWKNGREVSSPGAGALTRWWRRLRS